MISEARDLLPLRSTPEFSFDDEKCVTDAKGITWGSAASALTMGVFDLCGCGYADDRGQDFVDVLKAVRDRWDTTEEAKGQPTKMPERIGQMYGELILNLLDSAELVQHGGSVGGSWLTDLGRAWLAAIEENS